MHVGRLFSIGAVEIFYGYLQRDPIMGALKDLCDVCGIILASDGLSMP